MLLEQEKKATKEQQLQKEDQELHEGYLIKLDSIDKVELVEVNNLKEAVDFARKDRLAVLPITDYLKDRSKLEEIADAFNGIKVSFNVFLWNRIKLSPEHVRFFGMNRIPLKYLLEKKDGSFVALSLADFVRQGRNGKKTKHLILDFDEHTSQKQLFDSARLKFLNGDSDYTQKEIHLMRPWISEYGPKKLEKFFLEYCISNNVNKKADYRGSALKALFKSL